jgi:hypothetical protein
MMMKKKRSTKLMKDVVVAHPHTRYSPRVCVERLKKSEKTLSHDSRTQFFTRM